jgi:hypothetical protein
MGRNFSSWAEYFGPRVLDGNPVTLAQQYNLSNEMFTSQNLDVVFPHGVLNTSMPKQTFQWPAEDIIIVSRTLPQ